MISGVKDARGLLFSPRDSKTGRRRANPFTIAICFFVCHSREKNERALLALFRNSNNATSYTCTRGSGRLSFEVVFFLMNDYAPADD